MPAAVDVDFARDSHKMGCPTSRVFCEKWDSKNVNTMGFSIFVTTGKGTTSAVP